MSDEILQRRIHDLVNGTISEAGHRELQERLKSDPDARAQFRERMDLESGLRTWAADGLADRETAVSHSMSIGRTERFWSPWKMVAVLATAASILAIAALWTQETDPVSPETAKQQREAVPKDTAQSAALLGSLVQSADCVWLQSPPLEDGRFQAGTIRLASGAAKLCFDSGTNVILEGPCELSAETLDSARLLSGKVFVDVTEVSNGFLLETPEARIVDEGTQYAVSQDDQSTEVHVFDGSVIWTSIIPDAEFEERIDSGQARRYLRSEPGRPHHVPFGQREFVRRIEERVREAGGEELIAYDGFENLAGQLRRGRSGFGWDGGWESAGRGRGALAEVIDAPDDVVFGLSRAGRRALLLRGRDSLRRQFDRPVEVDQGMSIFVSLLVCRLSATEAEGSATRILLEPDVVSPRFVRRNSVSFGVASDGRLFVNNAGMIEETALSLPAGETVLLVFRYESGQDGTIASLRLYRPGETVDEVRPSVWTVQGTARPGPTEFKSIRLDQGMQPDTQVDELRIGYSWDAVVDLAN
jgi:FecR protein